MKSFREAVQRALGAWRDPRDLEEARRIQWTLARRVRLTDSVTTVRWVLGLDGAFVDGGSRMLAGAVLWDVRFRRVTHRWVATADVRFPYVPGFLSFRETPGYLEVLKQVEGPVDVIIVDGQGIAHPRGLGIAAHLGVLLDWPTLGVAKTRLFGRHDPPRPEPGAWVPLIHPYTGQTIGAVLTTRRRVHPIYVSPGHRVSLARAIAVVMACSQGYRLPEPQRQAHLWVTFQRKGQV